MNDVTYKLMLIMELSSHYEEVIIVFRSLPALPGYTKPENSWISSKITPGFCHLWLVL